MPYENKKKEQKQQQYSETKIVIKQKNELKLCDLCIHL